MNSKRFGYLSEAAVLVYLPQSIWASKDPKLSTFDILWHGIKIEVKGTRKNSPYYNFGLGNGIYTSIRSKWYRKSKMIHPDVFVFVGWNKGNIDYWVINKKRLGKKDSLIIGETSKWNIYKVSNKEKLGEYIERENEL